MQYFPAGEPVVTITICKADEKKHHAFECATHKKLTRELRIESGVFYQSRYDLSRFFVVTCHKDIRTNAAKFRRGVISGKRRIESLNNSGFRKKLCHLLG